LTKTSTSNPFLIPSSRYFSDSFFRKEAIAFVGALFLASWKDEIIFSPRGCEKLHRTEGVVSLKQICRF